MQNLNQFRELPEMEKIRVTQAELDKDTITNQRIFGCSTDSSRKLGQFLSAHRVRKKQVDFFQLLLGQVFFTHGKSQVGHP